MRIQPDLATFTRLARRASVIPVWGALLADLDTPVSAFMKLDDGRFGFLLESVEGEEKIARYSFLGSQPRMLMESRGRRIALWERAANGRLRLARRYVTATDPLEELERLMRRHRAATPAGLPRFAGGWLGYLGYDIVRFIERLPRHRRDPLGVPDLMFMLADRLVIVDHAQHTMRLVVNGFVDGQHPEAVYRRCVAEIHQLATRLNRPLHSLRSLRSPAHPRRAVSRRTAAARSNMTPAQFRRIVARAKTYIRDGDIIQTVLSQRFERAVRATPLDIYRALRSLNPSPYMFFLRLGSMSLVGASPEMLVRCEDGVIETRPLAGTRRRGRDEAEDARLIQQLVKSPKERAEHLMLVDLGRNDLGRVAQIGSVRTPEVMVTEKYSHVIHMVSSVIARLKAGKTAFDVLRAAFPAGTVAGAPKVRAMEIIAELESDARGPYAGAVGYIGFSGNLDTCITIRTILLKNGIASVQTGAGIVADSNPQREYQETLSKARGCLKAIEQAEHGLAG